jgi:hypothetical protein
MRVCRVGLICLFVLCVFLGLTSSQWAFCSSVATFIQSVCCVGLLSLLCRLTLRHWSTFTLRTAVSLSQSRTSVGCRSAFFFAIFVDRDNHRDPCSIITEYRVHGMDLDSFERCGRPE